MYHVLNISPKISTISTVSIITSLLASSKICDRSPYNNLSGKNIAERCDSICSILSFGILNSSSYFDRHISHKDWFAWPCVYAEKYIKRLRLTIDKHAFCVSSYDEQHVKLREQLWVVLPVTMNNVNQTPTIYILSLAKCISYMYIIDILSYILTT